MAKRQSIEIEGFAHKNPIPAASRLGNMLMTGIITGMDPATGKVAPKYRNPANASETWAGRGQPPRWLAAELKAGKKLEDYLIR